MRREGESARGATTPGAGDPAVDGGGDLLPGVVADELPRLLRGVHGLGPGPERPQAARDELPPVLGHEPGGEAKSACVFWKGRWEVFVEWLNEGAA